MRLEWAGLIFEEFRNFDQSEFTFEKLKLAHLPACSLLPSSLYLPCRSSHFLHSIFFRFRLLAERALAACAKRGYTGAMRTARKIRYRLEWLGLKFATKFVPLLSRKACYRLALLLGSLSAMLDRRGRRVALSNLRWPLAMRFQPRAGRRSCVNPISILPAPCSISFGARA